MYGKLKLFLIPNGPEEEILINFIIGLPKNLVLNGQNYNTILFMVNRFIKMANKAFKYYILSPFNRPPDLFTLRNTKRYY